MKQSIGELSGRVLAAGALVGLGQLGLTGCGNSGPNYSSCYGVLQDFSGDHSPGVTDNHATWKRIVVVSNKAPKGDIVVGYQDSHSANSAYSYSKPVPRIRAGTLALKIGPGDVRFIIQYAATQNSALCGTAPVSSFSKEEPLTSLPPDAVYPDWTH